MGSELVERLTYLVSLDERRKGGPYGGVAASECMAAMREAATTLSAQEEQIARLRELLLNVRNEIDYWGDTAQEHDLVAQIDAALEGSKRDG